MNIKKTGWTTQWIKALANKLMTITGWEGWRINSHKLAVDLKMSAPLFKKVNVI